MNKSSNMNNKAVPMGFETSSLLEKLEDIAIIKQSLWDLKPFPKY